MAVQGIPGEGISTSWGSGGQVRRPLRILQRGVVPQMGLEEGHHGKGFVSRGGGEAMVGMQVVLGLWPDVRLKGSMKGCFLEASYTSGSLIINCHLMPQRDCWAGTICRPRKL
jgi:hypothetical protein